MATKYKVDLAGVIYSGTYQETTQEGSDEVISIKVEAAEVFTKAQEALQKFYGAGGFE